MLMIEGTKKLTLKNKCGCTVLKKEIQNNRDKIDLPTESMLLKLKEKIGMKKKVISFHRGGEQVPYNRKKKNNQKKNYDIRSQIFVLSAG